LRGERTGIRYRLTDPVQVQVARVDLEARRIDFKLVKGTSFKALQKGLATQSEDAGLSGPSSPSRGKKAASTKPAALKNTTAKQRRAQERRSTAAAQVPARQGGSRKKR